MSEILNCGSIENIDVFGGKAKGLLQLVKQGLNVPRFYVIPFNLLIAIEKQQQNLDIALQNWKKRYKIDDTQTFSVRSSASVEDGASKSFAGLFSTKLNCKTSDLADAIVEVAAAFKNNSLSLNDETDFKYHIIIQEMVYAGFSGVAFSRNPFDPEDHNVIINIVPGAGSALVSGEQTGMTVRFADKKASFVFVQESYNGTNPQTDEPISRSHEALQKEVLPFIPDLAKDMKRLEKMQETPIDVEFCVQGGKLYWLQMRPITSLSELIFFDNTGISENYPGVSMPLTISFVKQSYYLGYLGMIQSLNPNRKFIESNRNLLANMVGGIDGALFYNITSWQKLLYQMPFGNFTSKSITRLLGMPDAAFEKPKFKPSAFDYLRLLTKMVVALIRFKSHKGKFLRHLSIILNKEKDRDYAGLSHKELVALHSGIQNKILECWIAPMLNGFFTLIFYGALKRAVNGSKIKKTHPNFTNDILFAQGDVVSVRIVRELQGIIAGTHGNPEILQLFRTASINNLKEELPLLNPQLYNQIIIYIDQYGDRSEEGELRMETVNYREDNDLFWKMLQENTKIDLPPQQFKDKQAFNYDLVLKQHYPYNFLKRLYFRFLIKNTIARIKDRENFRFLRTQVFAIFRKIFRAIDNELLKKQLIDLKNDSLFLEYEEILTPDLAAQFREIIAKRKLQYANFSKEEMPSRFVSQNAKFKPVFNTLTEADGNSLKGVGCCSGVVKGEVVIVDSNNIHTQNWKDKIAIARNFEPGWIALFANAKGLISERGSLLSHTSILCREMQIPSIVSVNGLLKTLKEGDFIEMDGSVGIINKIK